MIFLSYRQDASAATGGRIYDRLVAAFGAYAVRRNFDALPAGASLERGIEQLFAGVTVVLMVIGPEWLADRSTTGESWLADPADPTRLALEEALARGLAVLPLLLDATPSPPLDALPPHLQDLVLGGGQRVRVASFEPDMRRLVVTLARWIRPAPVAPMPVAPMPVAQSVPANGRGAAQPPYTMPYTGPWPQQRPHRARQVAIIVVSIVAAVILICGGAVAGLAYLGSQLGPSPFDSGLGLISGAAVTPDTHEVWAVTRSDLLVHYTKGKWSSVQGPSGVELDGVALFNSHDGWAVGARGVLLHYDGTNWTQASSPVTDDLESIALDPASHEGWAVGGSSGSSDSPAVILRFANGEWTKAFSPEHGSLARIAITQGAAGADAWAANTADVLHYQNGSWTPLDSGQNYSIFNCSGASQTEQTAQASYRDVSSGAAGDAWIAENVETYNGPCDGDTVAKSIVTPYLLHFSNGRWSRQPLPSLTSAQVTATATAAKPTGTAAGGSAQVSYSLTQVTMVSASEGWAFGTRSASTLGSGAVVLHFTGGSWQVATSTSSGQYYCMALDPDGEVWILGSGALHYQNGTWSTYTPTVP
ncbi:MAG TPA: toll/interleukin-1 receptor domain-containing protein [Ktedonobacterales bacterium]